MMTDINGALFPLSKNFLGTVKDPAWTVSDLCCLLTKRINIGMILFCVFVLQCVCASVFKVCYAVHVHVVLQSTLLQGPKLRPI